MGLASTDPLEMLARLCQHIPPPGLHMTRLYGAYSSRTRSARARARASSHGQAAHPAESEPVRLSPSLRERRRAWAAPAAARK